MNEGEPIRIEPAGVQVVVAGSAVEGIVTAAFDEYHGRLKAFALRATRDAEAADDIVQDSFLRLIREVREGRTPANVGGWLFRVASNLVASRGRRHTVAERAKRFLVHGGTGRSPEESAVAREADHHLGTALSRLPRLTRLALLMAAQGFSAEEIGNAIGRSQAATRTLICRARLRLREELAGEGDAS